MFNLNLRVATEKPLPHSSVYEQLPAPRPILIAISGYFFSVFADASNHQLSLRDEYFSSNEPRVSLVGCPRPLTSFLRPLPLASLRFFSANDFPPRRTGRCGNRSGPKTEGVATFATHCSTVLNISSMIERSVPFLQQQRSFPKFVYLKQ